MNTFFDRPSTMSNNREGPVLSRIGVRSMMTVTYVLPNGVCRLFRVECGRADPARVLGIDVEVLDDERTLTSAHSKDLDNAPSYVPLLDISGPLQPL